MALSTTADALRFGDDDLSRSPQPLTGAELVRDPPASRQERSPVSDPGARVHPAARFNIPADTFLPPEELMTCSTTACCEISLEIQTCGNLRVSADFFRLVWQYVLCVRCWNLTLRLCRSGVPGKPCRVASALFSVCFLSFNILQHSLPIKQFVCVLPVDCFSLSEILSKAFFFYLINQICSFWREWGCTIHTCFL